MKASEQYFHVVLFTVLFKVFPIFERVGEVCRAVLSRFTFLLFVIMLCGSSFWVCERNSEVWPFKWKLLSSTFTWYSLPCKMVLMFEYVDKILKCDEQDFHVVLFNKLHKVVLTFESVDEILKCDHSNESYWAVLSRATLLYAVQGCYNILCLPWLLLDQFGQFFLEGPAKINMIFFIQGFLVRYWLNDVQPLSFCKHR